MMKHILAVIALLGCTYPAQAQNVIPPLEYDHPYKGKLTVKRANSQTEIRMSCDPTTFPYHLGCAKPTAEGGAISLSRMTILSGRPDGPLRLSFVTK